MKGRFAGLRFLCDCLTPGLPSARIGALRSQVIDNTVNWDHVISSSNDHLVVTSLWKALGDKHLQDLVPEEVRSYLIELHRLNRKRNTAINRQADEIVRHLNQLGFEPLLLKGSAVLLMGVIDDPAERIMGDIDIMVRREQAEKTMEILASLGYRSADLEGGVHDSHSQHLPPMVRDRDPAPIEVHTALFHSVNDPEILTSEEVWRDSELVHIHGSAFRVLSPTHFVLYSAMHAQVHHECHTLRKIPLRSLSDVALVLRRDGARVDWQQIDVVTRRHNLRKAMLAYLYLGSKLLGMGIPARQAFSPLPWLHYVWCITLVNCPRLRAIHDRYVFAMEALKRVRKLFSSARIQARFGCSDGWIDLTKTRLQYSWFLVRNYVFGNKRSHLIGLLGGKGLSTSPDTAPKEEENEGTRR